jgi:trigger factor
VKARELVELFDYGTLSIPYETHTVTDESLQSSVDSIVSTFATTENITDRPVADKDKVNIDYVGSIDGVPFDGGDTAGSGTDVTIGETVYIDDFLEQLIGHAPGETFDVNVTFPEDYGVDNLNGKDAVFVTTINHIVQTNTPELTDAFVAENLTADYGWTTVAEMKAGLSEDIRNDAIRRYIEDYLSTDVAVSSIPKKVMTYQEEIMVQNCKNAAASYGVEFGTFLSQYAGASSTEELLASNVSSNESTARMTLAIQAIAEDAGITANEDDLKAYFKKEFDSEDYSTYEANYGMPYLKQAVLADKVITFLKERAVYADASEPAATIE